MNIRPHASPAVDPGDALHLIRARREGGPSLVERILSHVDPGPAEDSEAFVHAIYEQRRRDADSDSATPRN